MRLSKWTSILAILYSLSASAADQELAFDATNAFALELYALGAQAEVPLSPSELSAYTEALLKTPIHVLESLPGEPLAGRYVPQTGRIELSVEAWRALTGVGDRADEKGPLAVHLYLLAAGIDDTGGRISGAVSRDRGVEEGSSYKGEYLVQVLRYHLGIKYELRGIGAAV